MAEAKKMMESPEFQKQMKELSGTKEFKNSIKNAESIMKDPSKAAEMEARMEHMVKRGNDELKKGAANMMDETMAAMAQNPELINEMTKMMKDPSFQQQLSEMMKDPSFAHYREAVSIVSCNTISLSKMTECFQFIPKPVFANFVDSIFFSTTDARHDE